MLFKKLISLFMRNKFLKTYRCTVKISLAGFHSNYCCSFGDIHSPEIGRLCSTKCSIENLQKKRNEIFLYLGAYLHKI